MGVRTLSDLAKLIHEMRNQAAVVVNFAELLSDEVSHGEAKDDLEAIRSAGERLGELCTEFERTIANDHSES